MRTFPRVAVAFALGLVVALARAQSASDDKDIRALAGQLQDAWNRADARMMAGMFLTDGDYISSTGRTARGRVEVEKAFQQQWTGVYRGTKLAHEVKSINFVRRDVAIVDGSFEITGMKSAAGKPVGPRTGLSTIVASRKGDRWYIAALRGMVPSVPEGSPGK